MSGFIRTFLILLMLASVAAQAHAQGSCLPSFNALQEMIPFERGSTYIRPLAGMTQNGFFQTKVQAVVQTDHSDKDALNVSFRFDPSFEDVSLAFNLYAVLILKDGEVLSWMDLTQACTGPGISFFPGAQVELPKIKLVGHERQTLHIMVWGKF